jgi:hypothetical protein
MPRENGPDHAEAAVFTDAGTSRAVIDVTKHQGLASLSGFPFEVRTSASTREQARRLADRCARAYSYLGDMLAFRPRCALLVLNRADWSERASNPSYVMPYYDAGNLFLTGEPSDLTAWLEEVVSSAPPAAAGELDQVYGTGADRLAPFADMLVVHELAHAFHDGVPFVFPRSWLMELFANIRLVPVPLHDDGQGSHRRSRPGHAPPALGRVRPFGRAARGRTRRPGPPGCGPVAGVVERTAARRRQSSRWGVGGSVPLVSAHLLSSRPAAIKVPVCGIRPPRCRSFRRAG